MLKRVMIGLLVLSLVGIWVGVAQAGWVCLCNGGKSCCTYRSGSVIATQSACGVQENDFLGLTVTPPPGSDSLRFITFCQNKGQNSASGVQSVGNATASAFTSLEDSVDRNGCTRNVKTTLPFTDFFGEAETVCDTELNPNWSVSALVVCEATIIAQVLDEASQEVVSKAFNCRLPVTQCDPNAAITLGWDKKAGAPEQVVYVDAVTGQPCGQP